MGGEKAGDGITFLEHKDFTKSLHDLHRKGAEPGRKATKVLALLGALQRGMAVLESLPITKHGEGRVKNCVKYDLGGGYRLITVKSQKTVTFCFVGNHDQCQRWLDAQSAFVPTRNDANVLEPAFISDSEDGAVSIARDPIPSNRPLIDLLDEASADSLLEGLAGNIITKLVKLQGIVMPDKVQSICDSIPDAKKKAFVQDVFLLLVGGDARGAQQRIAIEVGRATELDSLSAGELLEVSDGDTIRRIHVGSTEHEQWLTRFSREASYLEWLMFLHPEQRAVVDEEFNGPAQLSGVSGAGKTCVAVKRAIRLAERDPKSKLLIVTLNRSLAGLIRLLVDQAASTEGVAPRIQVTSFFELCQQLLHRYEPDNKRLYVDVSWRLNDHIDEVFREFYRCWHNNQDAGGLLPIHQSLVSQGLFAETYVREELDWIRSGLNEADRQKYLTIERTGRKYPIQEKWRQLLLTSLTGWERKMRSVGVIDYLGLTAALSKHFDKLHAEYDHVLVDESQDFGTAELSILRRLAKEGPNDIFLCGDIAQHVLPKHRVLKQAGIEVGNRQRRITRNYRNSRQILEAAYAVLYENLDEVMIDSADMEILDPKYSSRSSPEPVVLSATSLQEEIAYARQLAHEHLQQNPAEKACIAFAGYTLQEVQKFAQRLDLPVLDGTRPPHENALVLSDLEQTKGYEFNLMIIVNCAEGVLPPADAPKEEAFRHGCRLYVAMTRARDQLYLSYHGTPSIWFDKARSRLTFDDWSQVMNLTAEFVVEPPQRMAEIQDEAHTSVLSLTGRQFNYTHAALGLSTDALQKIDELVDGVGLVRGGHRVKWETMLDAYDDLENQPVARQQFGSTVQAAIRAALLPYASKPIVIPSVPVATLVAEAPVISVASPPASAAEPIRNRPVLGISRRAEP